MKTTMLPQVKMQLPLQRQLIMLLQVIIKQKTQIQLKLRVSNASSHPKISLAAPKIQSKVTASGPSTSDISTPLDIDVTKVSFI